MSKLSENLKKLLKNSKLSENELSRRTGIAQQMINRIISSKNTNPKLDTLLPIASYFKISISQLIGDKNIPTEIKLSVEHLGWKKLPLLELSEIDGCSLSQLIQSAKKSIKTDINIPGEDGFAIHMPDASMDPKFPRNSLLIFDQSTELKSGGFYLILSKKQKTCMFRQVLIKSKAPRIKSLNPSHDTFKSMPFDEDHKIIASLVQARIDY